MTNMELLRNNIPRGKEKAIHVNDLALILGETPAHTKVLVQSARREGEYICSGNEGYWYAESEDEMKKYCRVLVKQAISRLLTVKPIRHALEEMKGQISLSDILNDISVNGGDNRGKQKEKI